MKNSKKVINYDLLRGKLSENKITQKKLAEILCISERAANLKINGKTIITIDEMATISEICGVSVSFFLLQPFQ